MEKYAVYGSKIGKIYIAYEDENITRITPSPHFTYLENEASSLSDEAFFQISEYLDGKRETFTFEMKAKGTPFQESVWEQLCKIPYGETRSYKDIAIAIGNPKAARAVGMANNKNPLGIAVPCHRVIGADGKMVGYASGVDIKICLLEIEKQNKKITAD